MMRREKITFTSFRGEKLAAALELAEERPRAYAIFAHCFTCSKDIAAASRISRALAALGLGVLRFDFTGLGNSDGDFANTNFSSNIQDIEAAAAFLGQAHEEPSVLIGHSLGGAAVLAVASRLASVRAVAAIAAPSDPAHVKHLFADVLPEIEERGEAMVHLGSRTFPITKQFVSDIAAHRLTAELGRFRKALIIFHSPQDQVVGIDHARKIYEAARHPKSFISLDGADHLLSRPSDSEFVAGILSVWSARYINRGGTA